MTIPLPDRTTWKAIRDAVVEGLRDLDLEFEQKVYRDRKRPFWPKNLPGCAVYSLSETSDVATEAPREYRHRLKLVVEIVVKLNSPKPDSSCDDALESLCLEVSDRLEADTRLGGLVEDLRRISREFDLAEEGDAYYGFATLTYDVVYRTAEGEHPLGGFARLRTVRLDLEGSGARLGSELVLPEGP